MVSSGNSFDVPRAALLVADPDRLSLYALRGGICQRIKGAPRCLLPVIGEEADHVLVVVARLEVSSHAGCRSSDVAGEICGCFRITGSVFRMRQSEDSVKYIHIFLIQRNLDKFKIQLKMQYVHGTIEAYVHGTNEAMIGSL